MFLTRGKLTGVALMTLALIAAGSGLLAQRVEEGRPAAGDFRGVVRAVDPAKHTLTIAGAQRRGEAAVPDQTFTIAMDAEVLLDDGRLGRSLARSGKLADVAAGALVTLRLSADQKTVEAILAEGPTVQGKLTSLDATKGTLTVSGGSRGDAAPAEKTYPVNKHAEVTLNDGRGRRSSLRPANLAELAAGCLVTVKLSPDQKEVVSVLAEGSNVQGIVKAVDAGKQTVTLTMGGQRGEAAEERTYPVAADADVVVDNEQPRRFFPVREIKLADLPVGALATLKLSPDQNTAAAVRAEGPTVTGTLKGVDPGKGTVIVVVGASRESNGEDKTYPVAKDARVWVDGVEGKFADLKAGDTPPPVMLKLSVDLKAVRTITVGRGGR